MTVIRQLFILVPSPHPTGPIKGAWALANALVSERPTTLVTLKRGPGADAPLDPRVERRSLADTGRNWRARVRAYRELLERAGGRPSVGSISMCLSADFVNRFCRGAAVTCACVRGNLVRTYRMDYGIAGGPLAVAHLASLGAFDHVVAITAAMASQVAFYARRTPAVVGNFVDEEALEAYRRSPPRAGPLRFVFLASLTPRKQPRLVVRAIDELRRRGADVALDLVGSGPLAADVAADVRAMNLAEHVTLHGQLSDPYSIVAGADVMVLPSLSEGMARSALEALYLGVPCVLRDADGNSELIAGEARGALFSDDRKLADTMLEVATRTRAAAADRRSLLPDAFRQRRAAQRYLDLLERGR